MQGYSSFLKIIYCTKTVTVKNLCHHFANIANEKVDYKDVNHRLHWLNIFIGNIKNNIVGIYHGVSKRDLPLFLKEQEYRINHRRTGLRMMDKIQKYILNSTPMTRKIISNALDSATPIFC